MIRSKLNTTDPAGQTLARCVLMIVAGLLMAGHLAGPAVSLFPRLAAEKSAENESETSDQPQETAPSTLADRSTLGVRPVVASRRLASAALLLQVQSARRRNDFAHLSPMGVRQRLNGCGAILRC